MVRKNSKSLVPAICAHIPHNGQGTGSQRIENNASRTRSNGGINPMNDILKQIGDYGIVPVIKIEDAEKAVPLAKALANGGLPLAEITFRTNAAAQAIKNITEAMPNVLLLNF